MDKSGTYPTPCPYCGGVVEWWWYGSDCRGNPGGSGIDCQNCQRHFPREDWEAIERTAKRREEARMTDQPKAEPELRHKEGVND